MKTQSDKSFLAWLMVVIATAIVCVILGYSVRGVEDNNGYSESDSIRRDSIITRIDTLKVKETKWRTIIKTIKDTDTVIYVGTDTACLEIIERKNRLIAGQDTLIELLDLECRQYSDLLLIENSRFNALSLKTDSLVLNYKDSLTAQSKTIKKEQRRTLFYKVTTTVAAALGIYGILSK